MVRHASGTSLALSSSTSNRQPRVGQAANARPYTCASVTSCSTKQGRSGRSQLVSATQSALCISVISRASSTGTSRGVRTMNAWSPNQRRRRSDVSVEKDSDEKSEEGSSISTMNRGSSMAVPLVRDVVRATCGLPCRLST